MDRTHERQPSPSQSPRPQDPLEGDWSEGIAAPLHAHGLPLPSPLGWPQRGEVGATSVPFATAELAGEAAVEAPADWGIEPAEVVEQPTEPSTPSAEEDFPVTLSEADEIVDPSAAPLGGEIAPAEWLVHPDADVAPAAPPAWPESADEGAAPGPFRPPREEPVATDTAMESAIAAAAEAAGAAPSAEAEAAFSAEAETPFSPEAETSFSPETETPFLPETETPPLREVESEVSRRSAEPASAQTVDAWGEPTAATSDGPPVIEPWALPVDTPGAGTPQASRAGEVLATDAAPTPPLAAGELTDEPPEPDWSKTPRELFSPLPLGATLSDEGVETERNGAGRDFPGASSAPAERATPRQLELVREPAPQTLEDIDLLVPVDDVTPPEGVTPVEPLAPAESLAAPAAPVESAAPPPAPVLRVPGEQRVAIHTRAGQTRRGTVVDLDLSQPHIPLEPQGGGSTETIDHSEVKAIFFMLAPGEKAEIPEGQAVRITFGDGRSIDGLRGDESPQGFFLVPLDAQRTNTRRIYVPRDAIADMVDLR